jgi:hypothetical protein
MEKTQLEIILSTFGYSNFKRLVVFCTEKEQDDAHFSGKW